MKYLKIQFFMLASIICVSCTNTFPSSGYPPPFGSPNYYSSTGPSPYPSLPPPRNDEEYNRRIDEDRDRDEVLERSRDRRRGDACEDKDKDHECKDQCRDMYPRARDRDECEELTVQQIESLLDVYEALEEADDRDLAGIDLEDLEVYLNVSIAGFDSLVRDYNPNEVREILLWIAENEDVTDTFLDEDDDYKTLEGLLKGLSRFSSSELEKPFTKDINRGTLFEEAIYARNEIASRWFLDYIFYTGSTCNNDEEVSVACFTVICKIGNKFEDEDLLEDWLYMSSFEDYIDDIIQGGINAGSDPKWDATKIDDPDDLLEDPYEDQTWVVTLCGGLI